MELGSDGWGLDKTVCSLRGGHQFRNLSSLLQRGDKVWFLGRLMDPIEHGLKVDLIQADCLSCEAIDQSPPSAPTSSISPSLKPLFNFLFNPMAILKWLRLCTCLVFVVNYRSYIECNIYHYHPSSSLFLKLNYKIIIRCLAMEKLVP